MFKKTILAFGFISGLWINSHAQQGITITGYVSDENSGETLISANVAILELNRGSATNTLGYFSIPNIEPGTYTIACSYIGYDLFTQEISLKPGENLRFDIKLKPSVFEGEEIVVESEAELQELKTIGTAQVKTELIKALPAIFEADVFRSIQYLPGVKSASDFSSGLYIRGGSPDQTLIMLDQTTVYNPSHFFGFFSTFNPDAIKDVRLFKGGYPAEYGGRLGSVLSVYNKDGNRNNYQGTVTLGMLASRAAIEGPIKNGSFMLAGRRSTLEPLLAALRQNTENIPSLFYFYDFNGKINYDASLNDKFHLAFYSGADKVRFPFADDAEFTLNYGNQTVSANWTHIFNEKVFSNFILTGSRYFNFPEFEFAGTPFERDNNIYDFSLKSDVEYIPNEKHQISTGIWAGVFTLRLQDRFDNQDSFSMCDFYHSCLQ
ncbi:MAG: TonB-dependent receptor [Balneolaceae bacterium]